jgi:hypothetical protein
MTSGSRTRAGDTEAAGLHLSAGQGTRWGELDHRAKVDARPQGAHDALSELGMLVGLQTVRFEP